MEDIDKYDNPITPQKEVLWDPLEFTWEIPNEEMITIPEEFINSMVIENQKRLKHLNVTDRHTDTYKVVGMEVGDDRVDLSQNPLILASMIYTQQEIFGMKTSEPDTYISLFDWNFCEVTSQIPCSPEGSFDYARKTNFEHLEYSDSPTLRIILDVQKSDRSHSSTVIGKASLLASRVNTPRASNRLKLELGSWLQDGCLNTSSSPEPKYIHKFMGGSGCAGLFGSAKNAYLYLKGYKYGSYQRVYASAINEARQSVVKLDSRMTAEAVLCSKLREKQEYLHATYASNIAIPKSKEITSIDLKEPIKPLYVASGSQTMIQSVENRLIQARRLISRKAAEVEIMRRIRIIDTLFGYKSIQTAELEQKAFLFENRKQYDFAIKANSAVQNLMNRKANDHDLRKLIGENFLVASYGTTLLTYDAVEWLNNGGRGEVYSIDDLSSTQDMYRRDEVSLEETLRVGGIPIMPKFNRKPIKESVTRAEIGLWRMTQSKEDWADNLITELSLTRELKGNPLNYGDIIDIFYKYREWVNDDTLMVSKVIEDTKMRERHTILVLSTDEKLCRNLSRSSGLNVILCPPQYVIHKLGKENVDNDNITIGDIKTSLKIEYFEPGLPEPIKVYIDKGSTDRAFMRMELNVNDNGIPTGTVNRKTFIQSSNENGIRSSTVKLEKLEGEREYPLKVFSSNGEEKKFVPTYVWNKGRKTSLSGFNRIKGLSRRFSKGTKGS